MVHTRHTHFIGINGGKIELRFAGQPDNQSSAFIDATAAALALAAHMVETGTTELLNSSSCNWPADDGRPDFDYDEFLDKVQGYLPIGLVA